MLYRYLEAQVNKGGTTGYNTRPEDKGEFFYAWKPDTHKNLSGNLPEIASIQGQNLVFG